MKIIIRISATTKIKFLKLQKTFRVSRAYCDKLINTFVTLQQIKDCSLLNILKKIKSMDTTSRGSNSVCEFAG